MAVGTCIVAVEMTYTAVSKRLLARKLHNAAITLKGFVYPNAVIGKLVVINFVNFSLGNLDFNAAECVNNRLEALEVNGYIVVNLNFIKMLNGINLSFYVAA